MISIKNNHFKVLIIGLLTYIIGVGSYLIFHNYQQKNEILQKNKNLSFQLQEITNKNNMTIKQITQKVDEISKIEKNYDSQENIEIKLKRIFKRLSIKNTLTLVSLKKLCIDHYIIVTKLDSKNQESINNFKKILSHLGEVKQSNKDKSILYIDYIMEKNNE